VDEVQDAARRAAEPVEPGDGDPADAPRGDVGSESVEVRSAHRAPAFVHVRVQRAGFEPGRDDCRAGAFLLLLRTLERLAGTTRRLADPDVESHGLVAGLPPWSHVATS